MNRDRKPRNPATLSQSTRSKLEMYGLAAAAAGMGLAALSSPAQAEVVFTPAHQKIGDNGVVLDLNHDGIADFKILQREFFAKGAGVTVYSHQSNLVFGTSRGEFASRLPLGYTLGPNTRFKHGATSTNVPIPMKLLYYCTANSGGRSCGGPWDSGTNGSYVGFQFSINGEVHFGWARLKVTVKQPNTQISVYLTGYAYETIANKPIVAGKTSGTSESSAPESKSSANSMHPTATLGLLSAGASALPLWRYELGGL
ncbi:MAG: hypothetical protein WB562_06380 [Candidatus Sulfotelmatobacter sp.]